jgi:hypothetical protein
MGHSAVKQNRKPSLSICVRSLRPQPVTSRFYPDENYRLRLVIDNWSLAQMRYATSTLPRWILRLLPQSCYLFIYLLGALSHY